MFLIAPVEDENIYILVKFPLKKGGKGDLKE